MLKSSKKNLVLNSSVVLHEHIEAEGKGRKFVSRFIEAGVAHYQEFGDILITKETLDKFVHTMVGCPVIINHKDITEKNADEERVGVVSNVWYNQGDGWYYCEGIIWDKQAIDLVKNHNWNVSCTYDFESDFIEKTHNGKKIDMEFTNGKFLHLALVNNPRYERANIVVNSKDNEKGRWVTIKGTHVFIPDGKQIEEVMKEKGWISEGKEKHTPDESAKRGYEKLTQKLSYYAGQGVGERNESMVEYYREQLNDFIKQNPEVSEYIPSYIDKDEVNEYKRWLDEELNGRQGGIQKQSDKTNDKKEDSIKKSEFSEWSNGRLNGEINSLEDEIDKIDDKLQMLDSKLNKSKSAVDKYNRSKAKGYEEDIKSWENKRDKKNQQLDELIKERESRSKADKKEENLTKDEAREADIALTMMAYDYEKRGNKGTVDRANELKEKIKKGDKLTDKDKKDIKTAIETYKTKEGAKEKDKEYKKDNKQKKLDNIKSKIQTEIEKIYDFDKDLLEYFVVDTKHKKNYYDDGSDLYAIEVRGELGYNAMEKLADKLDKVVKKYDAYAYFDQDSPGIMTAVFDFDSKKDNKKANSLTNDKAQNGKDIFMTVLNELENFVKGIVENACSKKEKFEEEETIVENEDKRKLIDEIGGILKGKVDEEVWRTIVGKIEKIAYEPSEETKADNKCKNEDEEKEEKFEEEKEIAENKKAKNEEKAEEKEEKVENSMDKAKEIAMGGNTEYKNTSYASQKERLELGNNY